MSNIKNVADISIVIPTYNRCELLKRAINSVLDQTINVREIIIVDDCSTDGTKEFLKELEIKENKNIKIDYSNNNEGKGASIRKGLQKVSGDIVLIQDADLEYDPNDYHELIRPIKNGYADVVYGSRFIGGGEKRVLYFWHTIGNKFLTLLSNMFSNLNLTDMEVCYKAFKSEVIKNIDLKENRFGFEPEVTAKIAKKNIRIYEIGIKYFGRKYSEGKKITWKDGFSAIRCILKYNFFN